MRPPVCEQHLQTAADECVPCSNSPLINECIGTVVWHGSSIMKRVGAHGLAAPIVHTWYCACRQHALQSELRPEGDPGGGHVRSLGLEARAMPQLRGEGDFRPRYWRSSSSWHSAKKLRPSCRAFTRKPAVLPAGSPHSGLSQCKHQP